MLERSAASDPERLFLVDEIGPLTRAGAAELARRTSTALRSLGVEQGEPVAIMLDNRREFVASWFGLAYLGAVEVPLNPASFGEHLAHMLEHSTCRLAIVQAEYLPQIEALAGRLRRLERVVVVGDSEACRLPAIPWEELEAADPQPPVRLPDYADPVAVLYTSGSSGPAKGVVVSHGQHYVNGYQPTVLFELGPDDMIYVCLPLHHNMAQGYGVWVALASGAALRLTRRFDGDLFWPDVRAHAATVLPFVGAMLVLLAKRPKLPDDLDNPLRIGFGVPVPSVLHEAFEQRFGIELIHCYGSTEATIVAWNHGRERVLGAVGRVLPDYKLRIVDEDDRPLPTGKIGQICIAAREPQTMFSGYFRDPERTAAAFQGDWFRTGDRGWLDSDGNLWFSDRMGDLIRRLGEMISSYDVEQAVLAHPEVKIAAAFPVPSELIEDEVMVAVVRQTGSHLEAGKLRSWCAERLPKHAVPRFIDFVDSLPMTPTGKVEKYKLRQRGVTSTTDDARARREVSA
jgi:crotonobetaine/carnitine-CoA ligase